MLNLIHDHPDEGVRGAAEMLQRTLARHMRATGRAHVVIIKDTHGCECRYLNGEESSSETTDQQLLDAFQKINEQHNTGAER